MPEKTIVIASRDLESFLILLEWKEYEFRIDGRERLLRLVSLDLSSQVTQDVTIFMKKTLKMLRRKII